MTTKRSKKQQDTSNTLVLLDGNNLAWRCELQKSLQELRRADGKRSGIFYGFLSTLQKLQRRFHPKRTVVVFDSRRSTLHRKSILATYKEGRSKHKKSWLRQVRDIQAVLPHLSIPVIKSPGVEADDLIAFAAFVWKENGLSVIVSSDHDFLQMIDKNIIVWDDRHGKAWDKKAVEEKYGFAPSRMAFYKALVGDTSDNIPGVPGIGEVTAKSIVQIVRHPERLQKKKVQENLKENNRTALILSPQNQEILQRNLSLIQLPNLRSEVREATQKLLLVAEEALGEKINKSKLKEMLKRYSCLSIINKLDEWVKPFE